MRGTYLLGGVAIGIESVYDEVHHLCADYCTQQPAVFCVRTTEADIEAESRQSDAERLQEGLPEYHFPPPYLETLAVYRQIAAQMLSHGVLLMHGSVIAVDGEGYMFTALSGTGKSTHVRLWRQLFGERAVMVNDDKPLIRILSAEDAALPLERPLVYGTPWDGKHHLSTNISVPLRAIVVLRRGQHNTIRPLTEQEAFPTLLQQSFRPSQPLLAVQALQLLSLLSQHVGLYELHCNMDPEAARVAYEGIA